MLKEALQYLVDLGGPFYQEYEGLRFTTKPHTPITPPLPEALQTSTLAGLVETSKLITAVPLIAQVRDPKTALLCSRELDRFGRRATFAVATAPSWKHAFGNFLDHESFVIWLKTGFAATEDRERLLRIASNLSGERVTVSVDDGLSQQATVRRGVQIKETTIIQAAYILAPYRTFLELEQPESAFVFRLHNGREDDPPLCALFEADGGAWAIEAAKRIELHLEGCLPDGIPVIR